MREAVHLYKNVPVGGEVLLGNANQHARPNDTPKADVWVTADMPGELKLHPGPIEVARRGRGRASRTARKTEKRLGNLQYSSEEFSDDCDHRAIS
jgi:hypothetical protein